MSFFSLSFFLLFDYFLLYVYIYLYLIDELTDSSSMRMSLGSYASVEENPAEKWTVDEFFAKGLLTVTFITSVVLIFSSYLLSYRCLS